MTPDPIERPGSPMLLALFLIVAVIVTYFGCLLNDHMRPEPHLVPDCAETHVCGCRPGEIR